ncbi:MAG: DNA mismatch endonuclease Vsr [Candidatus Thermoplasmatota archaeon]
MVELFAGVGGFRLGLDRTNGPFETVWWNQWEPATKVQHAWACYARRFHGDVSAAPPFSNTDVTKVPVDAVPQHDLLVGGFPCQDYSVATTLDKAGGLQGKKGVLWWEIKRILDARKPRYVLLENVDRLLKSPASQRGRDFGVLLACLRDLGYVVEWRVVNAADYGNPQRRRRVFIFAARDNSGLGKSIARKAHRSNYLFTEGLFAKAFPTDFEPFAVEEEEGELFDNDVREVSASFHHLFQNAGVLVGDRFWTTKVTPKAETPSTLGKHLERGDVDPALFIDMERLRDWEYQKGPKSEERQAKNGYVYRYTEGGMQFPDLPGSPARTVLTSEANRTPNRSTHVVSDPKTKRLRFLTPTEVERLMGFDDGWTESLPARWRYFTMGNALVVPLVTRIAERLVAAIRESEPEATSRRLLTSKPMSLRRAKASPKNPSTTMQLRKLAAGPVDPVRSRTMSKIGGKGTKPELLLRRELDALGCTYNANDRDVPGTPDFSRADRKAAVFLDGCFWHGCPQHYKRPKSRQAFWDLKLSYNQDLRRRVLEQLQGWNVLQVWACELKSDPSGVARRVASVLSPSAIPALPRVPRKPGGRRASA